MLDQISSLKRINFCNQILRGDCFDVMTSLPDQSFDMAFLDPPYNMQLGQKLIRPDLSNVRGVKHEWDAFDSFADYREFTKKWLTQIRRLLKENGTFWVIGSYHNIYQIGSLIQEMGFWILNDIIWRKTNPTPNFHGTRFANAHETILWVSQSKDAKYTFNYDSLKSLNDDLQMRSDWLFPISKGEERIVDDTGKSLHPTQKPIELLYRMLMASTKPGDHILDPFAGTGTTAIAAKLLNRKFLLIEENETYVKAAQDRLEKVEICSDNQAFSLYKKRDLPRVPFGLLLEKNILKPGQKLYGGRTRKKQPAILCSDGLLKFKGKKASIHGMGCIMGGTESCNGWLFWHVKDSKTGVFTPIDVFRNNLRPLIHI